MHRRVASGLVLAAVASLASCGDGKSPAPVAPAASPAPAAGATPLPADAPKLEFTDHAPALGLAPQFRGARTHQPAEDMGGGVAVVDFDNDGRPDVLVVGTGAMPQGGKSRIYHNETPLRGAPLELKDVTNDAGLPGLLPGMGVAVADVDGDGALDLLITYVGGVRLLHNEGGLRFNDVTQSSGLGDASGWCTGATFGDVDGDGDLDLYVCRYDENKSAGNLLYRNDGQGRFDGGAALAKELGVDCPGGRSLNALFGDLNNDEILDLGVAGERTGVDVFLGKTGNAGSRTFETPAGHGFEGATAFAAADADCDGDDDLFVAQRTKTEIRCCRNLSANSGQLLFVYEVSVDLSGARSPLTTTGITPWSLDLADFDLDGRLDLFAAGGSASDDAADSARLAPQRSLAFWNAGKDPAAPDKDRGFVDAGAAWGPGWNTPRVLRGGAAADLDGDGDPDVVFGALDGPPVVLINEGDRRGRPLQVTLRAPAPNTFAVGARVTVKCDGRTQSREMRSSPGYLSAGPLALLFGLGDAKGAATVSVRWPDGTTSEHTIDATERWPVITKSNKR